MDLKRNIIMSDQNKKTPANPNTEKTAGENIDNQSVNNSKKAEPAKPADKPKTDSTPTPAENKTNDKVDATKNGSADTKASSTEANAKTDKKPSAVDDKKTPSTPNQPQSTPKSTKPPKVKNTEKKGGKLATGLSILSLLGVAGVGTYGWFELQKLQGAVSDKVKEQQALIKQSDPSKKFDAFKVNIGERFNQLNDTQNTFKRELSEVKGAVSASVAERTKDQRDWVIAETEYLIQIANYRLRLLRDVRTATEALKSADRRIGELNDPAFFPVREVLAKEISSLQEVGSFDSSGVALKLLSVSKLVHKLPPALMSVSASQADIDDAAATEETEKSKVLKKGVMADVARWIGLKENNRPFKALPKQQDVFYLDQLLRLELEAARHAVLRFDESAYNAHIKYATALLKEHYDENNEQVAFVLKELRELKARNIFPELPDISESSVLINKAKTLYKPTETVGE